VRVPIPVFLFLVQDIEILKNVSVSVTHVMCFFGPEFDLQILRWEVRYDF
jgi:hypothetical protein